ncbi:MAG: response regulator [Rhodospirillaceae bacterium]|nr:MAG: response regulator [Rhodospirillaceae bacterium]
MARILVAEDDESVRQFVARALTHGGHEVTVSENGLLALDRLAAESYDLLLTDILMPGMDGIALALKASKENPDMPILLMTGYAAEKQRAHNLNVLIYRVISKPFTLKGICDVVDDALADKSGRGPGSIDGKKQ